MTGHAMRNSPIQSVALAVPVRAAVVAHVAARFAGAFAALLLFADQSYDGTRAFTAAVAILTVVSAVPVRGVAGIPVASLGAGLLFFAGSALLHYWQGWTMLAAGGVAGLGCLALAVRKAALTWSAVAFAAGAFLTGAVALLVIAATER